MTAAGRGAGLGPAHEAVMVPVVLARPETVTQADLVVVGAPTHFRGLSQPSSRKQAADAARRPGSGLVLAPGAEGPGLREWFASLGRASTAAAACDTRIEGAALLTGRASVRIARLLRRHGFRLAARPQSFLLAGDGELRPGEADRAFDWGRRLSSSVVAMKVGAG